MPQEINVILGDRDNSDHHSTPVVIILDRLRSVHNVGNILRLADAVRAELVVCGGYTACPPHPKLAKSAMGAEEIVKTQHFEQAADAAREFKNKGYKILGVETVEQAHSVWDIISTNRPLSFLVMKHSVFRKKLCNNATTL